jgi:hypothetical protein
MKAGSSSALLSMRRAASASVILAGILASGAPATIARVADGPAISINDVSVVEGNSGTRTAMFTVSLDAPSSQTVWVNYATADGSASLRSRARARTASGGSL